MSPFPRRRRIAALLLGLCLTASWASAAEPRIRPASRAGRLAAEAGGLVDRFRELFSRLLAKNGGSADSSGRTTDNGGSPDPSGRQLSQPAGAGANADNGGSLDPSG